MSSMIKLLIFVLMLNFDCFSKVSSDSHKNIENHQVQDVHGIIEKILNDLFESLKLNKNVTMESKNRQLLELNSFMRAVAEENHKVYEHIKNVSESECKDKLEDGIYNLVNLTEALVEEMLLPHSETAYNDQINKTGIHLNLTSSKIPETWEQSLLFLQVYFKNMAKGDLFGDDSPLMKIKEEFLKNRESRAKKHFMAWQISNTTEGESKNSIKNRRIYQGSSVEGIESYPFLASVHVTGAFVCAGSIISVDLVLTAATCVHAVLLDGKFLRTNRQTVQVRVGSEHTDRKGILYNVLDILLHPEYNNENLKHNLAILKLDERIDINGDDKKIRRVIYQGSEGTNKDFQSVVILGWGDQDKYISGETLPLMQSQLKLYDHDRCTKVYTKKFVSDKNFCAGFETMGAGACQRDVGGPALVGNILVGVVSYGPPVCGTPDAPTVFSNLSHYSFWINSIFYQKSDIAMKQHNDFNGKIKVNVVTKKSSTAKPILSPEKIKQFVQSVLKKNSHLDNNPKAISNQDFSNTFDKNSIGQLMANPGFYYLEHLMNKAGVRVKNTNEANNQENPSDATFTDKEDVSNSFAKRILRNNMNDGLDSNIPSPMISISSNNKDPFFLAIVSLGGFLGLQNYIQMTELENRYLPQKNNLMKIKHIQRQGGILPAGFDFSIMDNLDSDVSNNYETEYEGIDYIPYKIKTPFEVGIDKNPQEKNLERVFLKRNFVKHSNAHNYKKKNNVSDELVTLQVGTITQNIDNTIKKIDTKKSPSRNKKRLHNIEVDDVESSIESLLFDKNKTNPSGGHTNRHKKSLKKLREPILDSDISTESLSQAESLSFNDILSFNKKRNIHTLGTPIIRFETVRTDKYDKERDTEKFIDHSAVMVTTEKKFYSTDLENGRKLLDYININ